MIEIDPNVRIANNHTFTYEDDTTGLREGGGIVAYESESRLMWPATVTRIDRTTGYVELYVGWSKWRPLPKTFTTH